MDVQLDDEIMHFALKGILPSTEILAIHRRTRTLARLEHDEQYSLYPLMHGEQQFTRREWQLLLPLLECYPQMATYELLYASLRWGYARLSERVVERAYAYLAEVRAANCWRSETHGIRDTLSRARPRLRQLGLDATCLFESGYVLDCFVR